MGYTLKVEGLKRTSGGDGRWSTRVGTGGGGGEGKGNRGRCQGLSQAVVRMGMPFTAEHRGVGEPRLPFTLVDHS